MKKIFSLIILALFSFACSDEWLDVNEDPNNSVSVTPDLLFTEALTQYSASYRTTSINYIGSYVVQYWTSGSRFGGLFYDNQAYNIDESYRNNLWLIYSNGLKNLQLAITEAQEREFTNAEAQAKIMQAQMFLTLTNLYGDIPFNEALSLDINYPVFDGQQAVYEGILGLIDEGLAAIDLSQPLTAIQSQDLIYEGDMEKWQRYANSLKFRVLMIMVDKMPEKSNEIASLFNSNASMINSNSAIAAYPFFDQNNNENFMYKWGVLFTSGIAGDGEKNEFFFANNTLMDILLGRDGEGYSVRDPRTLVYFDPGLDDDPDEITGIDNDVRSWFASSAIVGRKWLNASTPDWYFTYAEQLALQAEAVVRGFISGDANQLYRNAVRANMLQFTNNSGVPYITEAEIQTYLNALPDINTLADDDALFHVQLQQYLIYYGRGMEGWTNWRRTEVPELVPTASSIYNDVMRRLQYDDTEPANNVNFPFETLPLPDEKMWFDL